LGFPVRRHGAATTSRARFACARFACVRHCLARPALTALAGAMLAGCSGGVLDPKGPVGGANALILLDAVGIKSIIVVPTIVATFVFAWWFRAGNPRAQRRPDFVHSGRIVLVVWALPILVILFLGGVIWIGSHQLDPYQPLAAQTRTKPLEVQVIALDWKWLFIYPEQGIAGVNEVVLPVATPVHFSITSGSVMNMFFVPQLGSMIAAMNISLVVGEFARTGWLPYPPLSETQYSPGVGVDYYDWSLLISGVGTLMTGINVVTTILKIRAPGMSYLRMSMFCWTSLAANLLIVAALPILTVTLAMLTLDRYLGFHFFTNEAGGNMMIFVNLIWAWGHPEVYILVLPAFGIFSEVISTFSGKPLFGYRSMVASDPDNTNNALALAFGVLIVILVVFGSLWIMGYLHDRVMRAGEMQHMMQMPR
jgi:heme/copper-type cytochrome/quinol oxidase subunit 2